MSRFRLPSLIVASVLALWVWSEPSARIVWKALYEFGIAERTVLWNTFAFHQHKPGEPYTNRTPRSDEVEANERADRLAGDALRAAAA